MLDLRRNVEKIDRIIVPGKFAREHWLLGLGAGVRKKTKLSLEWLGACSGEQAREVSGNLRTHSCPLRHREIALTGKQSALLRVRHAWKGISISRKVQCAVGQLCVLLEKRHHCPECRLSVCASDLRQVRAVDQESGVGVPERSAAGCGHVRQYGAHRETQEVIQKQEKHHPGSIAIF